MWRDGLWKTLWDTGIRGKMWRIIRNMYRNTQSCILVGKEKSEFFNIEGGVRQGCVLSPILFSIFINRLAKHLTSCGIGIAIGGEKIASLFYADDLVIIKPFKKD